VIFANDFLIPRTGFFRSVVSPAGLDAAKAELARLGVFVGEIDGQKVTSDESLFEIVCRAFRLPEYFGNNWDALNDSFRDFEWLPAIGYVVVVSSAAIALCRAPETMGRFIETCSEAASFWQNNERAFHLLLVMGTKSD
jgi:hypothetical protein